MVLLGNLSKLPGSPQEHRWADWAELLCLHSPYGELSVSDLAEAIERRLDWLESEGTDEAEPEADPLEQLSSDSDAAVNDNVTARARSIFVYIEDRARTFGPHYPFDLSDDRRMLILRNSTTSRDFYLFLTICASLRYVPSPADRTSLTSRYEAISVLSARAQFGPSAEVHLFGKNAELTTGRYTGLLVDKIKTLAMDLNERTLFDEDEFLPNDFGDNGLDVVAWLPTGDELGGKVVAFGQCACTPEWVVKQHSSSGDAWYNVMTLQAKPANLCYIPYDFRKPDGRWFKRSSIKRTTLIDRRRLFHYLGLANGGTPREIESFRDILKLDQIAGERGAGDDDL